VTCVQLDQWKDFHTRALERVSALPGVRQAAFVWGLPLTGKKWGGDMEIVGRPGSSKFKDRMNLPLRSVTPDYFDAMGIRFVDGRGFRPSDNSEAPAVAVVNEALAERYFPKASPIGLKLRFVGDTNRTIEIVGVVSNTRTEALSQRAEPEIYFPFWQSGAFSKHLIVRASSDPRQLAAMVKRELHAVDPTAAVEHVKTMEEIRRESVAPRTFAMRLLVGLSLVASALALVGIYGVLSLSVAARTKEIAVRMAIGAQWREILRLVLGEGFRLIALGVLLGAILAVLLGRVLETFLFEAKPADPITLGGATLLFSAVGLLACLLPACRAARVDPMEALRCE
jgi:putative ABC transport system permease protein